MFVLILTNFWHVHLYRLYPGGYMSLLHTLQSQNWQVRESGCYCLILHLDCILFALCCAATWSTGQQKGMLPLSSHGPRADLLQMPSICLSHQQSRLHPKVPRGGQDCCPQQGAACRKKIRGAAGSSAQNWSPKKFTVDNLFGAKLY